MNAVLVRAGRLLAFALLLLGSWAGIAGAATDNSTGQQSAAVGAMSQHASFTGQLNMTNFLQKDPLTGSPCTPGAADQLNLVCEHFGLDVQVAGSADVCVGFDGGTFGLNDADVFIVDATGSAVVSGETDANPECVTLVVAAAGHFEIQVNPSFVEEPTPITGTITFTPAGGGSKADSTPGPGPELEGNGMTADGGKFNEKAAQFEPKENKIHYEQKDEGCAFKSLSYTIVQVYGTGTNSNGESTGKAHLQGSGRNRDHDVTFVVDITDGGKHGDGDTFTISTSDGCHGGGPLLKGDVEYEISK
jgi:hypothetical protein